MKLALKRDLAPLRAHVLTEVDLHFAMRARALHNPIYDLKTELASRNDPALKPEADQRGLSVKALSDQILARSRETRAALLALDAERLALKARVQAAVSEQEIREISRQVAQTPT